MDMILQKRRFGFADWIRRSGFAGLLPVIAKYLPAFDGLKGAAAVMRPWRVAAVQEGLI